MTRKQFLQLFALALGGLAMPLSAAHEKMKRAPAFFVGHGSPINAIMDNDFTRSLKAVGESIEKPKAILMISAHWTPPFYGVTVHESPTLMYDFFGFPEELERVQYPAPNAAFLTSDITGLFDELKVKNRPLDHGAWSVLLHMFPQADIPVMQFGIHRDLSLQEHFDLAKKLRSLRDQGVMIIGSGNVTHNLRLTDRSGEAKVVDWAEDFDGFVKESILNRDFEALVAFDKANEYATIAHPTLEHYIPLLYVAAVSDERDKSQFPYEAIDYGTLSMRSWLLT